MHGIKASGVLDIKARSPDLRCCDRLKSLVRSESPLTVTNKILSVHPAVKVNVCAIIEVFNQEVPKKLRLPEWDRQTYGHVDRKTGHVCQWL